MGSVILCLILLAIMPDPLNTLHSSYTAVPPNFGQEEHAEVSSLDPKIASKYQSVDGIISALSNRNTMLVIPVFLVGIFRYTTLNVLIQYASVRFGLKISTGATFYTETAILNIGLFLFLVPRLTTYFRLEYNIRPKTIDLVLVRTSVMLLAVGCLAIGLAQSSVFLPIGTRKINNV
jgi:hypothetical protein